MVRRRISWWVSGLVLLGVLLMPSSSSAAGCTWEHCWTCVESWYGSECDIAPTEGRLCCNVYWESDAGWYCRAFDYYCAGVIVRDV